MKGLALIVLLLSPVFAFGQSSRERAESQTLSIADPALLNSLETQKNNVGLQIGVQVADASPALREAKEQYAKFADLFNQKKFDEAFLISQKLVSTMMSELGEESLETARAYQNLGFVQLARNKKKEAQAAMEKAMAIYEKNPDLERDDTETFVSALESFGYLNFSLEKYEKASANYQRAAALREKLQGADAKETISAIWNLANIKGFLNDNREAAPLYRRVLADRYKNLGTDSIETLDAFQRCECAFLKMGKRAEVEALKREFPLAKSWLENANAEKSGFIRAKEIKIEAPEMPQASSLLLRPRGKVVVRVLVDETGKVVHACAADNKTDVRLVETSEQAAYRSTYKPATLNGKAVKSVEVLIWNFSPP